MSWNTNAPDGTQSVKANNSILQDNTTYTKTTMNYDHYWGGGTNEDGRHKYVSMPNQASAPSVPAGMDGIIYALSNVNTQPFMRTSWGIMQMLGIRAMGVFNSAGTLAYSHNCTLVKNTTGQFTISFTTNLPNTNYLFLGGGIGNSADTNSMLECHIESEASGTTKEVGTCKIRTVLTTGSTTVKRESSDPVQAWFICFGG